MRFIKHHWFGLIISLFMLAYLLVFVLVLFAPRYDEQKRGFIPCTEIMAEELINCEDKIGCMLKTVAKNTWCDVTIVAKGFSLWAKGEQTTPWANYLFEPKLPHQEKETEDETEESLQEFYTQTPNIAASMQNLRRLNQELEEQIKNQEEKENKEYEQQ